MKKDAKSKLLPIKKPTRSKIATSRPKPRVPENHTTSQKGRAVEQFRHLGGVVLEKPNGSASPRTAIVQDLKGQRLRYIQPSSKHEQTTSTATSVDITDSHITIAAEKSLRSAGTSRLR